MNNDNPTVYSTELGRICPKCGQPVAGCRCRKQASTPGDNIRKNDNVIRVGRESKGRKGKTVTVILGVPGDDEALRRLLSDLKRQCGAGGAVKDGVIEIQGDHRDFVIERLKNQGFVTKKMGG